MNMDIDTLRTVITVVSFVTFVGIVLWAYSGGARRRFEEAARLPFTEDEGAPLTGVQTRQ
jgi:cytochrome c oxidase cbb3-type subunit IV